MTYTVTVKANFSNKLSATSVVLRIPTPLNTTAVDCKAANGKAKYVPAENVVIWKWALITVAPVGIPLIYISLGFHDYKAAKRLLLEQQPI